MWKFRKEFYDARPKNCFNGKKKPGLNFNSVPVDLTSKRYLLLKTTKRIIKDGVLGLPSPWTPALISGPQPPAPKKLSNSSTSSYLTSSHYDHGLWVYGLFKPYGLAHVICTCFKETSLLFNVHLKVVFNCPIKTCVQLTNTCSEITNSFLLTVVALSTAIQFRKSYLLFDTYLLFNK